MQSDRCGTHAEQTRFDQGWLTAKQRPQCSNCAQLETKHHNPDSLNESVTFRCSLGGFATARSAICNEYKERHHD